MRPEALFRALLWCYPSSFRKEYGSEMLYVFAEQLREARRSKNRLAEAAIWLRTASDVITIAPKEHMHTIHQDIRYALRTLAASPGFAAVAILSLALGIGANTAIFSLLNGVLLSPLPVPAPEQLVILSNPAVSGASIGLQSGQRALLTYAEFEQLRDRSAAFSGMMASQSLLDRWQMRLNGGEPEEVRGRMVSLEYFQVLGVDPLVGRTFSRESGTAEVPDAVISHDFWRRRFSADPNILGKTVTIRNASLNVIGVMPAGFFGETAGERPDLWVPLNMQPSVLPGRDWLHDVGSEKVMWLHVFGRLKPGTILEQAEANANTVFKNGLEAHYGSVLSEQARKGFLNQRLKLSPAATGASEVRGAFTERLYILLAVVGVVLLIACANLANLLLARGAVRQREIAVRLALGASRGRLIRQLATESLVLATAGGLAGMGAAYLFHSALVRLISTASESFRIGFTLDARVLGFSFALTLLSGLLFGLLPAFRVTRLDASVSLKEQGRATTGSAGQMRWGRLLVLAQIALSLPLLVGAGLFLRTLYNLQKADIGYSREGLLLLRVDARSAGYEKGRRAPLFFGLLEEIRRIPGIRAASFSENGLFTGFDSGDEVVVEGYTPTGKNGAGANWDQVGPGYFSTVGIPILLGREFTEADQAGSLPVCVINEAFAKLFFANRNPIGMRVTTVYGDNKIVHNVVGVVKDVRSNRIRGKINPRQYVPITQPLGEFDGIMFEIRTAGEPHAISGAVRQAIQRVDSRLPIIDIKTLEERILNRTGQDRVMAKLSVAFGLVALALAAIGLYGVLSYGVARRRTEIGIRIALGAEPNRVIGMILRESGAIVVLGLAAGLCLAAAAARVITSQLYGLTPTDPGAFLGGVVILVMVAFAAAWIPAHRASRVDPMAALRQD